MMAPHSRFCMLFDLIGATGLAGAGAAIFAERWLTVASEAALIQMSFVSIAIAVGAFLTARIAQMTIIVMLTPDPIALRVKRPSSAPAPTTLPTAAAQASEFQRAA